MLWYCDASAILKRYVGETGSQWFRSQVSSHQIVLAKITPLEVKSGLALRFRTGGISQFSFFKARNTFTRHVFTQQYIVLPLSDHVLDLTSQLVYHYPLRAYDAVQLTTALDYVQKNVIDLKQFCFLTADDQLERAARSEGVKSDNPNRHP